MLVTLASVKGSPGTTTWALAVAARWPVPDPGPLVVELDSAGGDIGSRWQLHDQPGLAGLALGARYDPFGAEARFAQRLPVGVDVVVAPPADAAAATVDEFSTRGPSALRELAVARPVLADLGRLDPQSRMMSYLEAADELLLVARPVPEQLRHLRARISGLAEHCSQVRLVLVGGGPYRADEIAAYLDMPVAATVPFDATGAAILAGRKRPAMGWTRRPLLAAARSFALTYQAAALITVPERPVAVLTGPRSKTRAQVRS
jgi:hypothetical protein